MFNHCLKLQNYSAFSFYFSLKKKILKCTQDIMVFCKLLITMKAVFDSNKGTFFGKFLINIGILSSLLLISNQIIYL